MRVRTNLTLSNLGLNILALVFPSVSLSTHPPICLCVQSPTSCHLSIRAASSPNFVASRSQMSPQCLTVRYVPAFHPGKGFRLISIRLHPSLLLCFCCRQPWFFPFCVCVMLSLGINHVVSRRCFSYLWGGGVGWSCCDYHIHSRCLLSTKYRWCLVSAWFH